MIVKANDPRISWQGIISLEVTDSFVKPWRIPFNDRELFPPKEMLERASAPAGVRLSFHTDSTFILGKIENPKSEDSAFLDVFCNGVFFESILISNANEFQVRNLSDGENFIEIWLPQFTEFRLKSLSFDKNSSLRPFVDDRPKWITYGSSITHCKTAEKPSLTWPSIVSREHGMNLTCLGYAGNCHLEPNLAMMIRDTPADFISIKLGINVHNHASMSVRTFMPGVIGFIKIIREKHPYIPIVVISPIFSSLREHTHNIVGFNLEIMRNEIQSSVKKFKTQGDLNLHYVDGLDIFGPEYAHLLPDDLHPNVEGYNILAHNFLKRVVRPFFKD